MTLGVGMRGNQLSSQPLTRLICRSSSGKQFTLRTVACASAVCQRMGIGSSWAGATRHCSWWMNCDPPILGWAWNVPLNLLYFMFVYKTF